ncbi:type II secretion system protein GspG [Marinicella meishanensis]|uniref:type II secretion system protein GspG n=1 Tax=Marinicella meishanensis TaxID=2873263 RepID=UPI001CBAE985|nr:type II secretion system protein GspG [Marinicella sp. NBU2979]
MKLIDTAVYFILAVALLLAWLNATERKCANKQIQSKVEMHQLIHAIELYKTDTGHDPTKLIDLSVNPPVPGWLGPYISEKELVDPWGHAYRYVPILQSGQIILYHLGADGEVGGDGALRDGFLLHSPEGTHEYIEPSVMR